MLTVERADRATLAMHQNKQLQMLLHSVYGHNSFYTRKLDKAGIDPASLRFPPDFQRLPLTTKAELVEDQAAHPPYGSKMTEPLEKYTRYCQTSSSRSVEKILSRSSDSWRTTLGRLPTHSSRTSWGRWAAS